MPVLECLKTLRGCFNPSAEANSIQNPSRKRWNLSGEFESVQLKQGCYADLSDATILELMKSSSLDVRPLASSIHMSVSIRNPHYVIRFS